MATHRAEYFFRAREEDDGTPWIDLELRALPDLPGIADGFLGMDLAPGTTFEQAKAFATLLNAQVSCVTQTIP